MLIYGTYRTDKSTISISVTTAGVVHTASAATSANLTYVATPTAGQLSTRSLTSAGLHYVATPTAGALNTKSLTSAGLHYVATPASAKLTTMEVYTINSLSFSGGKIIAGTSSAASTNITAGIYLCSARGNSFYCRNDGAAASLVTVTFPIYESESRVLRLGTGKVSTICTAPTGRLTLVRLV